MFQKFINKKGQIYVLSTDYVTTVDEMIAFLEQYRGMRYYVGAVEDLSFLISDGTVHCDSSSYLISLDSDEDMDWDEIL